jgi:hypothetical protein
MIFKIEQMIPERHEQEMIPEDRLQSLDEIIEESVKGVLREQYHEIGRAKTKKDVRIAKYQYEINRNIMESFSNASFFCEYYYNYPYIFPMDVMDIGLHGGIANWYNDHGIKYVQNMEQFNRIQSFISLFHLSYSRYLRFNFSNLRHLKLKDRVSMYKEFRSSNRYTSILFLFIWMDEFRNAEIYTEKLEQLNIYMDSTNGGNLLHFFFRFNVGDSMQIITDHISHDKRYKDYLNFPIIFINISKYTTNISIFSLFENVRFKLYAPLYVKNKLTYLELTLSVWAVSDAMEAMENFLSPYASVYMYKLMVIPKSIGKLSLPNVKLKFCGDSDPGFLFLNPKFVVRSACSVTFPNEAMHIGINFPISHLLGLIKGNKPLVTLVENCQYDFNGKFIDVCYDGGDYGGRNIGRDVELLNLFATKLLDRNYNQGKSAHIETINPFGDRHWFLVVGSLRVTINRLEGYVDEDSDDDMMEEEIEVEL